MENTNPAKAINKGSNNKLLILAALIVLFIATLAYGYFQNKNSKNSPATSNSNWAEFKSEKYGFKFDYPKEWGKVSLSKVPGVSGHSFLITFKLQRNMSPDTPRSRPVVAIKADTNNLTNQACDAITQKCETENGFSSKDINNRLEDKSGLVKYGEDYYSTLDSAPEMNLSQKLTLANIVNLKSLNISAVRGEYSLIGYDTKCPAKEISYAPRQGCIDNGTFDNLKKTLESFDKL